MSTIHGDHGAVGARIDLIRCLCALDQSRASVASTVLALQERDPGLSFLALLEDLGILGVALERITAIGAMEQLPGALVAKLRDALRTPRRRGALLGLERDHVAKLLGSSGIDAVFLKGAALIDWVYLSPGERSCVDIDVLVCPEQLDEALRVLAVDGYLPRHSPAAIAAYRSRHFHIPLFREDRHPLEVHWGLSRPGSPFGLDAGFVCDTAWPATGTAGPRVRRSSLTATLLHIVLQNADEGFRSVGRIVDVDRIVRNADVEWDEVVRRSFEGNLSAALYLSMDLANGLLGTPLDEGLRRRIRPTRGALLHLSILRPLEAMVTGAVRNQPSRSALLRFWLLAGSATGFRESARRALDVLRDDPLRWIWDGQQAPSLASEPRALALVLGAKIMARQALLYVRGAWHGSGRSSRGPQMRL